jgi:protein phosphatase
MAMSSLDFAGASDIGPLRGENQDRWVADPEQGLFLVADGMGGSANGKLAADVVAEVLPPLIRRRLPDDVKLASSLAREQMLNMLAEVSERMRMESQPRFGVYLPGATVVLALIRQRKALIAHLGDSRAYLLHDRRLRQLTRDHSLLQALVESGSITTEEAQHHPARAQLTRFVGMPGKPFPEAQTVPLATSDRLLLSSDGLHATVDHHRLETILAQTLPASEICRQLVDAALQAGGEDNITAIVIRVED